MWSLGRFGDLLWTRIPESRGAIRELADREFDNAIECDRRLLMISPYELASWFRHELLRPALDNGDEQGLKVALEVMLEVLRDLEDNGGMTEEAMVLRVVVYISLSDDIPTIRRVHPHAADVLTADPYAIHLLT